MNKKRGYDGRFVKANNSLGCSPKIFKGLLAIFSGFGLLGGIMGLFDKAFFGSSLFIILFWGFILWWALGSPKFWKQRVPTTSSAPSNYESSKLSDTMQWVRQNKFDKLKPKIEAGLPLSLDEYEEKNMRPFFEVNYPDKQIEIVRPYVIYTTVAGLQYHDAKKKEVKEMLKEPLAEILDLEREPTNKYGSTATKILWDGFFLGYVPSELSGEVSEAIDSGKQLTAFIEDYDSSENDYHKLKISIRIDLV